MPAPRRILALTLVSLLGLAGCSSPNEPMTGSTEESSSTTSATVIRVIDGDTVDVSLAGTETRVRLLNVDTPETKHPNKNVECLGPEATTFLERKLPEGTAVTLEYDVEKTDKFGRTLAGVFLPNGEFVNEEIARAGLGTAVVFEPNSKFYQRVLNAQNSAVNTAVGLFDSTVACSVPAQVKALDEALAAAETAEEVEAVSQEAIELRNLLTAIPSEAEYAFLVGLSKTNKISKIISGLSELIDAAKTKKETLSNPVSGHNGSVNDAERNATEEQRLANEAAEQAAAAQAEADRLAAEQAAAAQAEVDRIAAEQAAAAQAEAERLAAEQAAEAERQRQAQLNQPAPNPAPDLNQPAPAPDSAPAPDTNPYPGYTGPRCYAPGGKSWTPCPNR